MLFVKDGLDNILPDTFSRYFTKVDETTSHFTRNSINNYLSQPSVRTFRYGITSIRYQSIKIWNEFRKNTNQDLQIMRRSTFKYYIKKKLLNNYKDI